MAVLPWLAARVAVLGALAVSHEIANKANDAALAARVHQGLLGWDAGWYEAIARAGYGGAGHESLRFFPLVPILARALSELPGVGVGAALVVVANVSALAGTAAVAALARRETGDRASARRAAWLVSLAPPAFTFVMGYAEGTLLALSAATFLALRSRHWWWAAGLGALAALARPIGVLLVVPALCEVLRGASSTAPRGWAGPVAPTTAPSAAPRWTARLGRVAAVVGPAVGCGAFLAYVGARYGDALAPVRVQDQGGLRGGFSDPLRTLAHDARLLVHGQHLGTAVHLPWVVIVLGLLVVAFRRWPVAYGAYAAAVVAVAVTAANLDGFERYALSAFPLVLAAASVTASRRVERTVFALAAAGLALSAVLAFTNLAVP